MPVYHYECQSCDHALKALHGFEETLTECPACGEATLQRLIGASPKLKKQEDEERAAEKERIRLETRRKRGFYYWCKTEDCEIDEPTCIYHFDDEEPQIACGACDQQMVQGLPPTDVLKRIGVQFKGWWPDKRRKEVKARFGRQEVRAKDKGIDIEQLRGWAKRHAKKTMSPYLMDPIKDGRTDPTDTDNSTGHFHHEQEI